VVQFLGRFLKSWAFEKANTTMDIKIKVDLKTEPHLENREKPTDPFGETSRREPTDLRKAECPYCFQVLNKIPAAKTKCPHCAGFMFVRTRPEDFTRVVVTNAEAARIESDYQILTGAREPDFRYITTESEVSAERERLKESLFTKGCTGPSDDDVKLALLNKLAIENANNSDMGLSRNIYLTIAALHTRRWRLKQALEFYIYVCILDLNGAQNIGGFKSDPELLRQFPVFDPNRADLAPVVLDQIARIARNLRFGKEELRTTIEKQYGSKFPISADQCWYFFEKAIWPLSSSLRAPLYDPASIARAPQPNEIEQILDLPGGRHAAIWRDANAVLE
jgi:hypothetical protein